MSCSDGPRSAANGMELIRLASNDDGGDWPVKSWMG